MRQFVGCFVVITACGFFGPAQAGPATTRAVDWLAAEQECLSYAPSADFVAFDETDGAKRLLKGAVGYDAIYRKPGHPKEAAGVDSPAGYVFPAWRDYFGAMAPRILPADALLYLGTRRTEKGTERLVAVELVMKPHSDGHRRLAFGRCVVVDPKQKGWGKLRAVGSGHDAELPRDVRKEFGWGSYVSPYDRMGQFGLIRAGQNDPDDPSHFVIRFEDGKDFDILHGWLEDDDTIDLLMYTRKYYAEHPEHAPFGPNDPVERGRLKRPKK